MAIIDNLLEVITNDFSVLCKETNLVLNWDKCDFKIWKGIVLRHKISHKGIKVDGVSD